MDALSGTSMEHEIRWVVDALRSRSSPSEPEVASRIVGTMAFHLLQDPSRRENISSIDECVTDATGTVVTVSARDGSMWTIRAHPTRDGRVAMSAPRPYVPDLEIVVGSPDQITAAEWHEMQAVYAAAYDGARPEWLRGRLSRLPHVARASICGRMVGFQAGGAFEVDLGPIGSRCVSDTGVMCVDPAYRGRGVQGSMFDAKSVLAPDLFGADLAVGAFATPVTLRRFLIGTYHWPSGSLEEVLATLETPTATQKQVMNILAPLWGASAYDPDRWIITYPESHGATNAIPDGTPQPVLDFFDRVDQAAGEALFLPVWLSPPPEEWFH